MKLSFIIPAWNEEKYLGQALESILREIKKYPEEIEVIVVNNNSTDKTREIALSFPEIKLVDEPIKGLPQARQAGFFASKGELIANVDADSVLPSSWIGKVFQEFSKDEKLVALSGPYYYYDLPKHYNFFVKLYYFPGYIFHLFNQYILKKGAMLQGGNFVLKRSALEKIGGFNLDIKFYGEDTDIARRIQKVGKVKFDFFFIMTTSARRLKKEGLLRTAKNYVINYFWVIIFKKPFTQNYAYAGDDDSYPLKKNKKTKQ